MVLQMLAVCPAGCALLCQNPGAPGADLMCVCACAGEKVWGVAVSPSGVQVGQLVGTGGSLDISFSSTGARQASLLSSSATLRWGFSHRCTARVQAVCGYTLPQPCQSCSELASCAGSYSMHECLTSATLTVLSRSMRPANPVHDAAGFSLNLERHVAPAPAHAPAPAQKRSAPSTSIAIDDVVPAGGSQPDSPTGYTDGGLPAGRRLRGSPAPPAPSFVGPVPGKGISHNPYSQAQGTPLPGAAMLPMQQLAGACACACAESGTQLFLPAPGHFSARCGMPVLPPRVHHSNQAHALGVSWKSRSSAAMTGHLNMQAQVGDASMMLISLDAHLSFAMCLRAAPAMVPSAAPSGRRLLQAAAFASLGALPAAAAAAASHAEAAAQAPSRSAASAPDPEPWPLTALPAGALWISQTACYHSHRS